MAAGARRILLTLISGLVLAMAPMAVTFVAPAVSNAECNTAPGPNGEPAPQQTCEAPCPGDKVRSGVSGDCVDQMTSLGEQLQRLPPPPGWDGSNIAGINGSGLSGIPGIPSPVQVNMPDLVLPSVGLGLVPNLVVQPQFGGLPAPQLPNLSQLPPPQLPDLTKIPPPQPPAPPSLTNCGPTLGPFTPCI